ncbi:MAG: DEAD/DEAH box helicase [Bacteroidota bacterium]
MHISDLIEQAREAIHFEIEAVREKPSSEVLFNGVLDKRGKHWVYQFETNNQGLRFAEEIRARLSMTDQFKVESVEMKEGKVWLEFPKDFGKDIEEVMLEWENDFVLRKMEEQLAMLEDHWEEYPQLDALLEPAEHVKEAELAQLPKMDTYRNRAQQSAIEKSMINNILYVWGPPGTGKTATLGYIMANYLVQGKKVLFVSNTNRAVDVGVLNVMDALYEIQPSFDLQACTRFGDAALNDPRLEPILFSEQTKLKLDSRKAEAVSLSTTLEQFKSLQAKLDEMERDGEAIPESLDLQVQLLGEKVDREGGVQELEDKIDKLLSINERWELKRKQLVATTMAKVCTSELFYNLRYDAVVVDEASMAGLPFMLLMASRSDRHLVVVGDPMQLPPIALAKEKDAREFLERDIFTYVSGAFQTKALFEWHDQHPEFTCFFDTQYRLNSDLAGVISSVFYDGRLKSHPNKQTDGKASVALVDSNKYHPILEPEKSEYGFKPVNQVHQRLIEESIRKLIRKYHPDDIGVIVPFRNSVYKVRQQLTAAGFKQVEVGTIHTFQGREKSVIIFDTIMTGEQDGGRKRHYSVRPFDETKNGLSVPRLLNVAFSRSKELLVIIADMEHINRMYGGKFLGRLLTSIQDISL